MEGLTDWPKPAEEIASGEFDDLPEISSGEHIELSTARPPQLVTEKTGRKVNTLAYRVEKRLEDITEQTREIRDILALVDCDESERMVILCRRVSDAVTKIEVARNVIRATVRKEIEG